MAAQGMKRRGGDPKNVKFNSSAFIFFSKHAIKSIEYNIY